MPCLLDSMADNNNKKRKQAEKVSADADDVPAKRIKRPDSYISILFEGTKSDDFQKYTQSTATWCNNSNRLCCFVSFD